MTDTRPTSRAGNKASARVTSDSGADASRTSQEELIAIEQEIINIFEHAGDVEYQRQHFATMHARINLSTALARIERLINRHYITKEAERKWIDGYLLAFSGELPFEALDSLRSRQNELNLDPKEPET